MKKLWGLLLLFSALAVSAETPQNPYLGLFPENCKTIAIIAPAYPPVPAENLERALQLLREAGYQVREMPHLRDGVDGPKRRHVAPEKRKADLEQAK